ncbi:MAG: YlbG family protein [Vulcanibacillus sp.]
MFPKRLGLIVWVNDARFAKSLERFGNLIFISKRLKYAVLYIDKSEYENKVNQIEKLNFVKMVEKSFNLELQLLFSNKALNLNSESYQ